MHQTLTPNLASGTRVLLRIGNAMNKLLSLFSAVLLVSCAWAQQDNSPVEPMDQTPVFHVKVLSRTTKAVNYRHRGGSTSVDFKGTDLSPAVTGKAKVNSKAGRLQINADFSHLDPPSKFGMQYLTYVLWAITPEGRAVNLGEVVPKDGKAGIEVTTDLQAFGLILTAEPYFAVTRPSNEMVAENVILQQTEGLELPIDAKFELLEGGQYTINVPADQLPATTSDPDTQLDLLEARNAVAIAKAAGAAQYAPDSLSKAEALLAQGEDYLRRKQGRTPIGSVARGASQAAEDARVLTLDRKEQERVAAEKRATEERRAKAEADAKAAAEAQAQAEAQTKEAQAQAEEDARKRAQAEADRLAAEKAQAEAEKTQAQAEAASAAAMAEQQKAQADAERSRMAAADAIRQKEEMRARLLKQLNQVLETHDTAKGLIVSMPDVLFAVSKYDLVPAARERLARISGIVLAYPDLKLEIDGYTDSTGSESFNQMLSEKRAAAVRDYLVGSGVSINNVVAEGYGQQNPVAPNNTAAGRKLNRRVELIVSGDVIGTSVNSQSSPATGTDTQTPQTSPPPDAPQQ
jgi:outer membrane protein OmpA-like peptidoglycan-associated protein